MERRMQKRAGSAVAIGTLLMLLASGALYAQTMAPLAQNYPNKPVRILVGFPPGGSNDIAGRILANGLSERWGTPVVVENRPGGTGMVALQTLANAAPDGYTLYVGGNQLATFMMKQQAVGEVKIDTRKVFQPMGRLMWQPYVIVVLPSIPAKNIREFIAYAKTRPGALNYSSTGIGAASHLNSELFCQLAGIKMVNVPYKGAGQIALDLAGGQIHMSINNVVSVMSVIRSGKVRPLAITSLQRAKIMPELPTADESGMPGFEVISWLGSFAPANTPQSIVNTLNREGTQIFNSPEIAKKIAVDGSEPIGAHTPEQFRKFYLSEIGKWENLVKTAGIKLE
jgi:tripartite-type tricarboxylate transporter receptor subunit TctC